MRLLIALALSGALLGGAPAAAPRLNVLFIAADDLNNDLGCYGHPFAKTPNLDRLSARGVRFDRAYCQYPLCSPSRSSLMTGLRPGRTRVYDLNYHFRDGLPGVVTMSQLFKNAGAPAVRVGKIYHYGNPGQIGTPGLDDPGSWTEAINPSGRDKDPLEKSIVNHTPKRGLGSSLSFLVDPDGADEDHTDGKVATETIRLLEKHRGGPFFIAAGFYKPHCPFVAPKKYFDLYPPEKITLPPIPEGLKDSVPAAALGSTGPWPHFGVEPARALEAKRAYYATISFMDAQVGRVMEAMDRLKLWDSTIVVFWSDHGYHLGEKGLWMKMSLFEASARIPMIVAAPGMKGNGKGCARTVESIDLYPTLADLAGLEPPKDLDGKSLRPLLEDPESAWDRPACTQLERGGFPGYSVRTERWRYTTWDEGRKGEELYDLAADPKEERNLAGDPAAAKDLESLRAHAKRIWPERVPGGKAKPKKEK
jgi:uncharacterized sulfatase